MLFGLVSRLNDYVVISYYPNSCFSSLLVEIFAVYFIMSPENADGIFMWRETGSKIQKLSPADQEPLENTVLEGVKN